VEEGERSRRMRTFTGRVRGRDVRSADWLKHARFTADTWSTSGRDNKEQS
jgi:hypothetical protein